MKTLLTTFAILTLTLAGSAPMAEARDYHGQSYAGAYAGGYGSCGTSVRTERYLIGYDRCGYPMWGYRTVYVQPRYYAPPCPPPRYYAPPVYRHPQPYYRGSGGRRGPSWR